MNRIKRPAAAVGAAAFLAISLTACGGGASGAPEDASKKDFCKSYVDTIKAFSSIEGDKPTEKEFDKIISSVEAMGETGTPDDVSEGERNGFVVFVDEISDLSYEDVKEKDTEELAEVSDEDDADVDKFTSYAGETCADELTDSMTE